MLVRPVVAVFAFVASVVAKHGSLPTFSTAPNCGNGVSAYCCNSKSGAGCQAWPSGKAQASFCQGGVTICCTQNAGTNDIQICLGEIVGNLTINIYGCPA